MTRSGLYRCQMCGKHFLLRASLFRHKRSELPGFIDDQAARRVHYDAKRVAWRAEHLEFYHLKTMGRITHE